jgi:hypothetical protein
LAKLLASCSQICSMDAVGFIPKLSMCRRAGRREPNLTRLPAIPSRWRCGGRAARTPERGPPSPRVPTLSAIRNRFGSRNSRGQGCPRSVLQATQFKDAPQGA